MAPKHKSVPPGGCLCYPRMQSAQDTRAVPLRMERLARKKQTVRGPARLSVFAVSTAEGLGRYLPGRHGKGLLWCGFFVGSAGSICSSPPCFGGGFEPSFARAIPTLPYSSSSPFQSVGTDLKVVIATSDLGYCSHRRSSWSAYGAECRAAGTFAGLRRQGFSGSVRPVA